MMKTRRQMFVALLAVGFLAAGCVGDDGGSGDDEVASLSEDDSSEGGGGDMEAEFMQWAECMRDEGVDMPDPVQNADGDWMIDGPGGLHLGPEDEDAPPPPPPDDELTGEELEGIEDAEQACVDEEPPLSASQKEEVEKQEAEAFEFAQCMRDEGVADFPDPDFSGEGPGGEPQIAEPPPDDEAGEQVVQGGGPFGHIDMDDPGVAAAFEACQGEDIMPTDVEHEVKEPEEQDG